MLVDGPALRVAAVEMRFLHDHWRRSIGNVEHGDDRRRPTAWLRFGQDDVFKHDERPDFDAPVIEFLRDHRQPVSAQVFHQRRTFDNHPRADLHLVGRPGAGDDQFSAGQSVKIRVVEFDNIALVDAGHLDVGLRVAAFGGVQAEGDCGAVHDEKNGLEKRLAKQMTITRNRIVDDELFELLLRAELRQRLLDRWLDQHRHLGDQRPVDAILERVGSDEAGRRRVQHAPSVGGHFKHGALGRSAEGRNPPGPLIIGRKQIVDQHPQFVVGAVGIDSILIVAGSPHHGDADRLLKHAVGRVDEAVGANEILRRRVNHA